MKIVYVFFSAGQGLHHLLYKILLQLEEGTHGSTVVGMCFFDENALILQQDNPYGVRLADIAQKKDIVLMYAQKSDLEPKLNIDHFADGGTANYSRRLKPSECTVITIRYGEHIGCFPDLYAALSENRPEHVISL